MANLTEGKKIVDMTLDEAFGSNLVDTSCVYIDKKSKILSAAEMCAQHLESEIDSIVVLDGEKPVGLVGGYDVLEHLRNDTSRESQHLLKVKDIMVRGISQALPETRLGDLLNGWKNSRRAFACIPHGEHEYSPISARSMLELGIRVESDICLSTMPKTERPVTFSPHDDLGQILDLMFKHKTRKLVLEGTNQFISDRLILGDIARMLRLQQSDLILEMKGKNLHLGYMRKVEGDIALDRLCILMDKMDHPYVMYKNAVVTPWDVCLALQSENLTESQLVNVGHREVKKVCPNCGAEVA